MVEPIQKKKSQFSRRYNAIVDATGVPVTTRDLYTDDEAHAKARAGFIAHRYNNYSIPIPHTGALRAWGEGLDINIVLNSVNPALHSRLRSHWKKAFPSES